MGSTKALGSKRVRITAMTPSQQSKTVNAAIAQRAFQIWKSRRGGPGESSDDWRRAESEICGPLTCGFLVLDDRIRLNTDPTRFGEADIEIYIEPRRLTISGVEQHNARGQDPLVIFRSVNLPEEIQPSRATARCKGHLLEVDLPKAVSSITANTRAEAA